MPELHMMTDLDSLAEWHDFSLVLGGPFFQLLRKVHLEGNHLEFIRRRLLFVVTVAWLPLSLLAIIGHSAGNAGRLSFLHDVEAHVRFLVALPILIAAELIVHLRLRPVVRRFVERRIVSLQDLPRFDSAIQSAIRLRNSIPLECGLVLFVYTAGAWVWNSRVVLNTATWYALPGGRWHLTPAGFWYVFVSIPIFQFILLRWYLRFFIWSRFLWQVSRLNLHLVPTHPDRSAGLAFLGKSTYAFGPLLFAQGALLAGVIATRVLYGGQQLMSFKLEVIGLIGFFVLFLLGPLTVFTPRLARTKRSGLAEYGALASEYVTAFDQRWIRGGRAEEPLLGSADIQSLSDMGQSYSVIREMNVVPFALQDITRLAIATAAPLLPLALTVFSAE